MRKPLRGRDEDTLSEMLCDERTIHGLINQWKRKYVDFLIRAGRAWPSRAVFGHGLTAYRHTIDFLRDSLIIISYSVVYGQCIGLERGGVYLKRFYAHQPPDKAGGLNCHRIRKMSQGVLHELLRRLSFKTVSTGPVICHISLLLPC